MAHSSLLCLVLFLTWSGAGHTASYPNLECCCSTKMRTFEGNIMDSTTLLICFKAFYSRSIPKSLPPSLKVFNIRHQKIPNMMPGDFPPLPSLKTLTIRRSQVMTIQPGSFQTLSNLFQLSLKENKITRLEAQTFRGLAKLTVLDLSKNRIHYIDDAAFVGLTRLSKLSLSRNCLSGIPRGTDQSIWPLELDMMWNPVTSLTAPDELKHISRLVLARNGLLCDCTLREMKRWMTINGRWSITCGPFPEKTIRWLSMDNLKCDYKVSVSSDYGTVTGNVSLTCQTDCWEGLDLTFAWIAPNGGRLLSTSEYSRTFTDVRESYCKETNVTRRETKKTCYSVLRISTLRLGMEGRYTCQVTANHANDASASVLLTVADTEFPSEGPQNTTHDASTRPYTYTHAYKFQTTATDGPGSGLSLLQLVLVGLSPFAGCFVIVVVIVSCASKCKGSRQQNNANRHSNAARKHYGTNESISDTDSAAKGVRYENDDQFSDTDSGKKNEYENDDQFSDTDADKKNEYENDDQFLDTDSGKKNEYENNDQFSDDDNVVSKQPQRTVPHKLPGKKPGKTPSIGNAGKTRPCRNQKSLDERKTTRSRRKLKSNVLRVIADVHAQAQASGHYDNDKNATGSNIAAATSRTPKVKSNVLRVLADIHAQAQASGHYDNDTNAAGISNSKTTTSSDNVSSDGQYDNERPATDSETTKRSDDGNDSDQEYMTLPNQSPGEDTGNGEKVQSEGKPDDRNITSTSACADDVSDNDYVTFPGEENSDGKTRKKDGRKSDLDSALSNAEHECDHTYVTFPGEEGDEKQPRGAEKKKGQVSDLDTALSNAEDHTYVTFPEGKNEEKLQREAAKKGGHLSDIGMGSSSTEENSDHTYVTFPSEENYEEHKREAEHQNKQASDLEAVVTNSGDISDHVYMTFPETENERKRKKRQNFKKDTCQA
ncbi:corticospinal neuron axon guidance through spinal cord [Branchiostoma belcheri]|nr:corticospinal neuron axon guidance through spinal cord [Branchiostoma belcheri]